MVVEVTIKFNSSTGKITFSPDPVKIPDDGTALVFWNNLDSRGDQLGRHWMAQQGGDPKNNSYTGWRTPIDGPQLPQYTDPDSGLTRPGNTPPVAFAGGKGAPSQIKYWCAIDKVTIGTIILEPPPT